MSRRRVYAWPTELQQSVDFPAANRQTATIIQAAASKFANRYSWVFRTRWDHNRGFLRVRRAA